MFNELVEMFKSLPRKQQVIFGLAGTFGLLIVLGIVGNVLSPLF